MTDYR